MRNPLNIIITSVLLLIGFVLGLKQLHEPDLWWMIRTGEWMLQNQSIPTTDVFSYTREGAEWISVKWLFELLAYGITSLTGPESVAILQSLVNVLLVWFFIQSLKSLSLLLYKKQLSVNNPLVILGTLLFLFFSDYRMVGRPEMFSHLFTLLYLYLFLNYKLKPSRHIFWLIPLQVVWVNMHEGYAIGIVLILLFGIGYIVDSILTKSVDKGQIKQLLLASVLAIAAVAINPRGIYMYYHPIFIFNMVGDNHYTSELNSFFYRSNSYLAKKEPNFSFLLFFVTTLGITWRFYKEKYQLFTKISVGYLVAILAFFYLGLTWHRNVIFTIIITLPLALIFFSPWIERLKSFKGYRLILGVCWILLGVFYISIVTNIYYSHFHEKDQFGLNISGNKNPIGAANFAKENNLNHTRCFSDYLTSSYFLWELRPHFKTFIDLRDLDIFPMSFFDDYFTLTYFTNYFKESDKKYQYNYAMLYTWQTPHLHKFLYHSDDWTQVYADNIAAIYVKNNASNKGIIQRFKVDSTNMLGNFNNYSSVESSLFSSIVSYSFNPFYQSQQNDIDTNLLASRYFRIVMDWDRSDYHAQIAIKNKTYASEAWNELGNLYLDILPYKTSSEGQSEYLAMAQNAFRSGVTANPKYYKNYEGLGRTAVITQNYSYAIKQFKKSLDHQPNNAICYLNIAQCYGLKNSINPTRKNFDLYLENMRHAYSLDPDNNEIRSRLGIAYYQDQECEKALNLLQDYKRSSEINDEVHNLVMECLSICDR